MTDWDWFLSSEAGRDRILRGEIEGLQQRASSANAQSARLSSQLTQLQGSMETRLKALSAAFDAYVELGDVREQLDGCPDTSAVRRDAVLAIDVLSRGGVPDPVEDRGVDYWLAPAVNTVIALVGGGADPATERRAVALSPDAELFVVAAAGALGAGLSVADRVAPLLTCDGSLVARQVVLFSAVLAGVYGPRLDAVHPVWRSALDQSGEVWADWVRASSRTVTAIESLRWLSVHLDLALPPLGTDSPPPLDGAAAKDKPVAAAELHLVGESRDPADPAVVDPRTGLRAVVVELVGQGIGDEAALLSRSRALRAKIEDPTAPDAETVEVPHRPVTDVVQEALLDPSVGPDLRRELVGWVAPGLVAATRQLGVAAQELAAVEVRVNTEGGILAVGPEGPDPQRLARAETTIAELTAAPLNRILAPAVATGLLVVGAGAVALAGHPRGSQLLLLAAGVAAVVLGYLFVDRRRALQRRGAMSTELHTALDLGRSQAAELRQSQQRDAADTAELARRVITRLETPDAAEPPRPEVEAAQP